MTQARAFVQMPPIREDAFVARLDAICLHPRLPESGRLVLDESVYRFPGFKPVAVDLLADWTADPLGQRSWQWGAAAFNFLPWLIAHHARTGDNRAIDFAMAAIASWQDAVRRGLLRDYEFRDHDHATALRGENAALLLAYLHRNDIGREHWYAIVTFVDDIASLLEKESFYSRHTNHGLEQSRILAMIADLLPGQEASVRRWETATARMLGELRFAFTEDGVHVENSPAYHQYVCDAFLKIADMFPRASLRELNDAIDEIMPKAMQFLAHVVRPDGKFPIIGDTAVKWAVNPFDRYAGSREHAELEYVASRRTRGTKPACKVAAFPLAGYVVARDRWKDAERRGREFHAIMKCGFKSTYHRHDDDFNIVLSCGEDWLIDGGAYNYAEQSQVRRYLRSKWAHNVPVVDAPERWPRLRSVLHPASMEVECDDSETEVRVRARSGGYPGYDATRNVVFMPQARRFVVHDLLQPCGPARDQARFHSLWHVPAHRDVFVRGQDVLVRSRRDAHALVIRNVGPACDRVGILRPGLEHYANAVVSWQAQHLEPAKIIAFSATAATFDCRLEFELVDVACLAGWERA